MQKDEIQAFTLLRRFQSSLGAEVESHQADIANFYGDYYVCLVAYKVQEEKKSSLLTNWRRRLKLKRWR